MGAELRLTGDRDLVRSCQELGEHSEAISRTYEQRAQACEQSVERLEQTSKEAAGEIRLLQDSHAELLMRISNVHNELRMESDLRSSCNSQLSAALEQMRNIVAQ